MLPILRRSSLVEQVAAAVRSGLTRGEWVERLPPERILCRQLGVSRPTLRDALELLQRERRIRVRHGKASQVCRSHGGMRPAKPFKAVDVLLVHQLDFFLAPTATFLKEIELQLRTKGFEVNWRVESRPNSVAARSRLEKLILKRSYACWMLVSPPFEIQRLFMRAKVPTLVAGMPYPGIDLPCIDVDYRAVCRHAAQTFLRHGHRRIIMLAPRSRMAGDLKGEQAFEDTVRPHHPSDGQLPPVIHCDDHVEGVQNMLNKLFRLPHPPTAILVSRPIHALTVVTYLLNAGFRIPDDVAIISRDSENFLKGVIPSLACYVCDDRMIVGRLVRAMIQLASAGTLKSSPALFMPPFRKGMTLGPAPKTP